MRTMTGLILHSDNVIWACGIFAFIGNDPRKYFSWDKFNMLGIFNDSRGGDACGRVVGNFVEYGVDKLKDYKNFIQEVKPTLSKVTTFNTILGHCRKASSGGKADIYAQPVILYKKDVNISHIRSKIMKQLINLAKDDDIVFSGIHNGTIDNYKELAEKYKIPLENHNDSRVLLSILFYSDYKVLTEYIGTATLIWQNHLMKTTFVFKGASKNWENSVDLTEERPLFAWKVSTNNYYLSSMPTSLKAIQDKNADICEIMSNKLYKFKEGVNTSVTKYDRSSCVQNKVYYKDRSSTYKGGNSVAAYRSYEEGFDEDDTLWNNSFYNSPKSVTEDNTTKLGEKHIRQFKIGRYDSFRLCFETTDTYVSKNVKKVVYNKGRYWMNGALLHGVYPLSPSGIIPAPSYVEMFMLKPYYFVEGIMLDGVHAYEPAMKLHADFMDNLENALLDPEYEEDIFTMTIAKYSRFPIVPLLGINDPENCYAPIVNTVDPTKNLYTGDFQPLFSYRRYSFLNGELRGVIDTHDSKSVVHTLEDQVITQLYINMVKKQDKKDFVYSIGADLLKSEVYANQLSPLQKYIIETKAIGKENQELDMFLINYMRDFDVLMGADCKACVNEKTIYSTVCSMCPKFKTNLTIFEKKRMYGIFN
jgi:hypothetical protein